MAWLLRVAALVALSLVAGTAGAADALRDLRLPVAFYLNGQVKTELFAKEAVIAPDGTIRAEGITFRFLTETGEVDGVIEAERCVCNRVTQTASSDAAVSLTRSGLRITGVGFEWQAADQQLKILSQARVELSRPAIKKARTGLHE
jgi:lipopolysaccharide export system protein LptC